MLIAHFYLLRKFMKAKYMDVGFFFEDSGGLLVSSLGKSSVAVEPVKFSSAHQTRLIIIYVWGIN